MNLFIAFFLGGWAALLLDAHSEGRLTTSRVLYLLCWPLYGIITLVEVLNKYSSNIMGVLGAIGKGIINAVKWVIGLFRG